MLQFIAINVAVQINVKKDSGFQVKHRNDMLMRHSFPELLLNHKSPIASASIRSRFPDRCSRYSLLQQIEIPPATLSEYFCQGIRGDDDIVEFAVPCVQGGHRRIGGFDEIIGETGFPEPAVDVVQFAALAQGGVGGITAENCIRGDDFVDESPGFSIGDI